jgi:hypothetical protein
MKPRTYIAGDNAGLDAGKYQFYFGYEETVCNDHSPEDCENCEWAFVAKLYRRELMRIPQSKLGVPDGADMSEYLLAGLAKCIAEHMQ